MILQPLAVFGISYLTALLAAVCLPPAALLLPAAFLAVALLLRTVRGGRRDYFIIVLAGGLTALLGLAVWRQVVLTPVSAFAGQTGTARVSVLESSDTGEDGFMSAVLQIEQWQGQSVHFKAQAERCPEMEVGECAFLQLTLQSPEPEEKLANYAKGVYLAAEYQGGYAYIGESGALWARLTRLRLHLSHLLRRWLSAENGAMAAAMAVGDRTRIDTALRRLMSRAGISHLLVVSGLHVSLVCAALQRRGARRYRLRAVLAMGVALFLMALTGFTPSVCRAGITAMLCYTAVLLTERPDGLTNMALAGMLLCVPQPYRIADISMQLSFAATLGMIFSGTVYERAARHFLAQQSRQKPGKAPILRRTAARAAQPLLVSFMASLFVVPVLLLHDMAVSGAGILGNLLTMWLVPYILLGSWCVILAGLVPAAYPLYRGLSLALELLLRALRFAAQLCAALPFSRLPLPQGYTCLVLAVLAALVWLAWYRRRWRWLAAAMPLVLCLALGIGAAFQKDTVELALVGSRTAPCLVITQNAHTAVIFRGGVANCRSVENYLDNHGLLTPDHVVDLRLEPGRELPAGRESAVLTQCGSEEKELWPGVWLKGLHTAKGNLAVVDISGWQMALSAGTPQLKQPLMLDAYGAGMAVPEGIEAETVLTKSTKFKVETAAKAAVYRGSYAPKITVRPGRSVCYTGGAFYGTE